MQFAYKGGDKLKMNKFKDNSGSAMTLAIFIMIIISIVIISFTFQVGNQLKSTIKSDERIQDKYDEESNIESGIAKFIESINVKKVEQKWGSSNKLYVYYEVNYDEENLKNIEIKPNGNNSKVNKIIIDADTDESNNDPNNKPNGNSNSKINCTLEFKGEKSEISIILVTISNIKSEENYNISYEIIDWREK